MSLKRTAKTPVRLVKPLVGLLLVLTFAAPMYSAQNKSAQLDWLVEAKATEQARDFGRAAESAAINWSPARLLTLDLGRNPAWNLLFQLLTSFMCGTKVVSRRHTY